MLYPLNVFRMVCIMVNDLCKLSFLGEEHYSTALELGRFGSPLLPMSAMLLYCSKFGENLAREKPQIASAIAALSDNGTFQDTSANCTNTLACLAQTLLDGQGSKQIFLLILFSSM